MQPDCQLRTFNAKVTSSFTIAFSPCFHSCPPTLVPSLGTTGKAALDGVLPFPIHDTGSPRTWRSSAIPPNRFGPSLVILCRFPPRPGPLGLIFEMGQGTQILWPHNSPSKSCCLDPRIGRRVLMSSGYLTGLSSLVICWRLRLFRLLTTCFWRFGILSVSPLNSGGFVFPTLDGVMAIKQQGFPKSLWARKTKRLP